MSLLSLASSESCWRGYSYYKENKVLRLETIDEYCFKATVSGSGRKSYSVEIDLSHPRRSSCTCPHAAGKRVICKHMIATYFAAFPEEATSYYAEIIRQEEEWEDYQEEVTEKIRRYVQGLKKHEAQELLWELLQDGPEWQWERFIRDHIE